MTRKLVYRQSQSEAAEEDVKDKKGEQQTHEQRMKPESGQRAMQVPADADKGLYRPLKQRVTIRLDADVIEWFKDEARSKGQGRGYQTLINRALREYMNR